MVAQREETPVVHSGEELVETKLHRIAEKARKEPGFKFTSLREAAPDGMHTAATCPACVYTKSGRVVIDDADLGGEASRRQGRSWF
jgi:hypothetical protein